MVRWIWLRVLVLDMMNLDSSKANQRDIWNGTTFGNPQSMCNTSLCDRVREGSGVNSSATEAVSQWFGWGLHVAGGFKSWKKAGNGFSCPALWKLRGTMTLKNRFGLVKNFLVFSMASLWLGRNSRNFIDVAHINMPSWTSLKPPLCISLMEEECLHEAYCCGKGRYADGRQLVKAFVCQPKW